MRVLLVENDPEWRMALDGLYRRLLPRSRLEIDCASTVKEAEYRLAQGDYDLLSLDILLDGRGDGRALLETARLSKSVRAAVVISGYRYDAMFEVIIDSPEERKLMQMTLPAMVQKAFSGPCCPLEKDLKLTVDENVDLLAKGLRGWLHEVTRPRNVFARADEGWRIGIDGGQPYTAEDRLGLGYLHVLIRRQGKLVDCLTLEREVKGCVLEPGGFVEEDHMLEPGLDGIQLVGPGIGDRFHAEERRRFEKEIRRLEQEIRERPLTAAELNEKKHELWFWKEELRALHRTPDEQLKSRVGRAIRRTILWLQEKVPEVGGHVSRFTTVSGGEWCYRPDSPVSWLT